MYPICARFPIVSLPALPIFKGIYNPTPWLVAMVAPSPGRLPNQIFPNTVQDVLCLSYRNPATLMKSFAPRTVSNWPNCQRGQHEECSSCGSRYEATETEKQPKLKHSAQLVSDVKQTTSLTRLLYSLNRSSTQEGQDGR